jgi:hypothetical protein
LAIHGSDGHRVEVKVIGQEDELPLMLCVPPDDASEEALIVAGGVLREHDHLISADARALVGGWSGAGRKTLST